MRNKVYFFESHPVQYKAPVYQALNAIFANSFEVIYATDASMKPGHIDKEFGSEIAWDTPLLTGYPFRVLGNERGTPLSTPSSLSGKGIFSMLRRERPAAIVLTQMKYRFDQAAYLSALLLGIPILIRQETQDEMFAGQRSRTKEVVRWLIYRVLYSAVDHAFAFGKLNQLHLRRHGIPPEAISHARFSVPNPIEDMPDTERLRLREQVRSELGVAQQSIVVAFFGKLIPKKQPDLIYDCLAHVEPSVLRRLHILFVGAGELVGTLRDLSGEAQEQWFVKSSFAGFINQSRLHAYYLASDVLVLPSRRMGEAWGLVVNEALQAGCCAVLSDAVGCSQEFCNLERVRIIPVGDAEGLGQAIASLSTFDRDLHWAEADMRAYSTNAAAEALKAGIEPYVTRVRQ